MCKQKEITLKQDSNFGEIYIERVNVWIKKQY
jgi:chromatin segregation and condensation protein Rec8/ScpA/Scc1 (kleisin family)